MDTDEKSDGQGFVLVGDPDPTGEATSNAQETSTSKEPAKESPNFILSFLHKSANNSNGQINVSMFLTNNI